MGRGMRPDLGPTSRPLVGILAEFQQPLIDQYVSKYTPDSGSLSTPLGSYATICGLARQPGVTGGCYFPLGSFSFWGYNRARFLYINSRTVAFWAY